MSKTYSTCLPLRPFALAAFAAGLLSWLAGQTPAQAQGSAAAPGEMPAVGAQLARSTGAGSPVVLELFTSQGCSSCPPADELLARLADRTDLVPLSVHVDYWDYIGWKDPYASAANTERQRRYAQLMGLRMVYTPQMVVNGHLETVGSSAPQVDALIAKARAEAVPGPQVAIYAAASPSSARMWEVAIGAAPEDARLRSGTVLFTRWIDRVASDVARGENRGRRLSHRHVMAGLTPLGGWTGAPARYSVPAALVSGTADATTGNGIGYGILVQAEDGRYLAALRYAPQRP